MIGAVGKTAKGCSKVSKMVRYGSKIVGRIGNIALGSYQTGSIAVSLYDKHVVQGESWDWDSTVQLFSAGLFATTTVVSAKGLANDLSNYSSVKYDIQTSQCFVEGTLVLTKEGNKPIEEIQAGDLVYATDPETGGSGYKEVLRTFRKESDVLIHVFVNGEEIETTAVHPFWVENRWVSAKDLKEGDLLTLADGSAARISGVYGEKLDEAVVVYNFEVEEFHTYYVTDTGILVHNANKVGGCGVTGNKSGSDSNKLYWGSWDEYEHIILDGQEYAKIGDRLYSWHAVERMQPSRNLFGSNVYQASACTSNNYGRSVAPKYIEDVISNSKPIIQENGNLSYILGSLQVITNSRGNVVTVITK